MTKQKISLFLASTAFMVAPTFSFAAPTLNPTRSAERTQVRCEVVNNMITAHLKNMEARKDLHVEVYTAAHTRWVNLAIRLKSQGYDTTKLDADLATLDNMVKQLSADYQTLVDQVKVTQNIDCSTSLNQFKTQLAGVRTQLTALRDQAKKVHDFIRNTIRPDLTALRQQKPKTVEPSVTVNPESEK